MSTPTLSPIKPIHSTGSTGKSAQASPAGRSVKGFAQIMEQMIDSIEQTEAVTHTDAYRLAVGETDDLHTAMINAAKADIALQSAVQIRNKMLDAYNEIMRINL